MNTAWKCALAAALSALALGASAAGDEAQRRRLVGQADYYVREFEKEVARQRGGEKAVWRTKRDALERVQRLKTDYPDDPEVDALFRRVKSALMKSKGDYTEVAAEWTAYKRNEEALRKVIADAGAKAWNELIAERGAKALKKPFPAPDYREKSVDDLKGKKTANSASSTYAALAEEYGATLVPVDTLGETMDMLVQGRVDATINAQVSIADYLREHPEAKIKVVQVLAGDPVAYPLHIGEEYQSLVDAINDVLEAARQDGRLAEISMKYFGVDMTKAE